MKRYLPVTYVDENGEVWTKDKLQNKLFKRHETEQFKRTDGFTGNVYIDTIVRIENVRDKPKQGTLF